MLEKIENLDKERDFHHMYSILLEAINNSEIRANVVDGSIMIEIDSLLRWLVSNGDDEEIQPKEYGYDNPNLLRQVNEFDWSVRLYNVLKAENIFYIGDLVQKTEGDMMRTPNFGRTSLNEIREVLAQMGLSLGMELSKRIIHEIESKRLSDKLNG